MTKTYRLHVNGSAVDIVDPVPGQSLMTVLRETLGLRGTKSACSEGECGSCSVLIDGELMCSCLVLAASAVGRSITTVEGLSHDGTTDLQRAFVDAGAVQCGFCTPGLIVAAHSLLERQPDADEATVREELAGNLCRCTGYGRIIDAVHQVAIARRGGA